MKKTTAHLLIVILLLLVMIIAGTVNSFVGTVTGNNGTTESVKETHTLAGEKNISKEVAGKAQDESEAANETQDYETIYLDYIDKNTQYFSRGMMLCDLNGDDVPELFSIAYDGDGDVVRYHALEDNAIVPPDEAMQTHINIDNLIRPTTFYEDTQQFLGIYKNVHTGKKALINSIGDGSENDRFDIFAYDGERLSMRSEGVRHMENNAWSVLKKRDSIMKDYELVNDALYAQCLLRGEYGSNNDAVAALTELIADFKAKKNKQEYNQAKNGELSCYIRNIDMEHGEIELIPVAYLTYDVYSAVRNSENNIIMIDGHEFSIQTENPRYKEYGIVTLFQMPWFSYECEEPTEAIPVSMIEDFRLFTPIKVKMRADVNVLYHSPTGDMQLTMQDYRACYAQYALGSYHKAMILNDEMVSLEAMYHP